MRSHEDASPPFAPETGEVLLFTDTLPVIPANSPPRPGTIWLTNRRIVARWTEPGSLLRANLEQNVTIPLIEVRDVLTPGGPMVRIVADPAVLTLQCERPLYIRQMILEAANASSAPQSVSPGSEPPPIAERAQAPATDGLPAPNIALHDARPEGATPGEPEASAPSAESSPGRDALPRCAFCEATAKPGAHYCGNCGHPLFRETYCRRCGLDYPAQTRFCERCGDALDSEIARRTPDKKGLQRLLG